MQLNIWFSKGKAQMAEKLLKMFNTHRYQNDFSKLVR